MFASALTLSVGRQEGHTACKNLAPAIPEGTFLGEMWATWPYLE